MIYLVNKKRNLFLFIFLSWSVISFAQPQRNLPVREHICIDDDWRFAFGHPYDTKKDFDNGTSYFSYFAKASYGDGAF
ncbi:MAG: hypothetical protein ABIO55_01465 [Ginsengibacter sp.]